MKRFGLDQRGAVLVEMTLITPLVLTLAAGVFEFSSIIHTKLLIEAGIEDGARYLARCIRRPADKPACETAAKNMAVTATTNGTGALRATGCSPAWATGAISVTYPSFLSVDPGTGDRNYLSVDTTVEVADVSTTCQYVGTGLLSFIGFSPLTLTVSHDERILGW